MNRTVSLMPHQVLLVRHALEAMLASIKKCRKGSGYSMTTGAEHACDYTLDQIDGVLPLFVDAE